MYFVGLPERENMTYAVRVEALRRRFGQEMDTSIAMQELAGLTWGKKQSAKELADSARRLASQAYYSNDYASQEKAALHPFQAAVGEVLQLKCAEQGCKTLEMAVETVEIQERYTRKALRAMRPKEPDVASCLKLLGDRIDWARPEEELGRYWGWLCSMEGRPLECLGRVRRGRSIWE